MDEVNKIWKKVKDNKVQEKTCNLDKGVYIVEENGTYTELTVKTGETGETTTVKTTFNQKDLKDSIPNPIPSNKFGPEGKHTEEFDRLCPNGFKVPPINGRAPKDAGKDGKPRPSLIPMDILIEFVLPAYEEGLLKYEKESWRRGFIISELMDAAERHITSFLYKGEDYDKESAETFNMQKHHLAGAIFSLLSALHTLKYHPELDDRREIEYGNKNRV